MRYWHPFSDETAQAVRDWQPDEVVLLPLYPHYSTTTTGSSLTAWREAAARAGLVADTVTSAAIRPMRPMSPPRPACLLTAYDEARSGSIRRVRLRVLFSAHGLPEVIVRRGDPYQWQIEQTVAAVLAAWRSKSWIG